MEEKKKNPVDTKLLKLSNELQNSLRDPETKDYVQDIIAALAFGNFPNLGQRLATLARDPRVREEAMNKVRNFTGDEGPRLHESEILKQNKQLIEEIRQMKESMGLPKDSSMGTEKQAISFDQQGKIEAQEPPTPSSGQTMPQESQAMPTAAGMGGPAQARSDSKGMAMPWKPSVTQPNMTSIPEDYSLPTEGSASVGMAPKA